jgi:cell division protein FtsI/penicillin-binding protein 2
MTSLHKNHPAVPLRSKFEFFYRIPARLGLITVFGSSFLLSIFATSFIASAEIGSPTKQNAGALSSHKLKSQLTQAAKTLRPVETSVKKQIDWSRMDLDLSKAREINGKLVQQLSDGTLVTFTVDLEVQRHLEKIYQQNKVPYGGVVLMEPNTGRIIAMISHSRSEEPIPHMARQAVAPSASVFKIITAAALLETAGISSDAPVCYHGGRSFLTPANIKGDEKLDKSCGTLSDALAWSINSIIAKLAYKNLSRKQLSQWAEKFGYNQDIPFELKTYKSIAEDIEDPLERARMAAGFWHSTLSPLHGAMIGAAIQNDGIMMQPSIVEKVESEKGLELYTFKPKVFKKVMEKKTANELYKMLLRTNTVGTARKYFAQRTEFPRRVVGGGKTGTLSRKTPYLGYTWYVGFADDAEVKNGKVAVSGLTCNSPIWHIKGPWAASEAVRKFVEVQRKRAKQKI